MHPPLETATNFWTLSTVNVASSLNVGFSFENEKSRDTDRNDVSRLHMVRPEGFEPPTF